jgi:VanZ family protein
MMSGFEQDQNNMDSGKIWRWLPVALWLALIFTMSSIPLNGHVVRLFRHQDKLIHVIEYGILGCLLARAVFVPRALIYRYWGCIGVAVLVGAADEIHQSFIPGRMMDWKDLLADTTGALIFVWLWLAFNGAGLFKPARVRAEDQR